jgi:hypothetical protein
MQKGTQVYIKTTNSIGNIIDVITDELGTDYRTDTDGMRSISELEILNSEHFNIPDVFIPTSFVYKNNWCGIDENEISIKEYGILLNEKENILLYGCPINEQLNDENDCYLYQYNNASEDDIKEILKESFIKIDYILKAGGYESIEEWNKNSLIRKYDDLLSYYGYEDVLGGSFGRKKVFYNDMKKLF